MKKFVILILITTLIIGAFFTTNTHVQAVVMPIMVDVDIGRDFAKITPKPSYFESSSTPYFNIYKINNTFATTVDSATTTSITLIALYPVTIVTPTTYIATYTLDSLIIGSPSYIESITPSSTETGTTTENTEETDTTETSTDSSTSTETITSSTVLEIPEMRIIPPQEQRHLFFYLSEDQLFKLLSYYVQQHKIEISTATIKAIAKSTAKWSQTFGIDPLLILAQIRWESKFNPNAVSVSEAKGLMQLKDFVYQPVAKFLGLDTSTNAIFDIDNNIAAGTYYLHYKIRTWGREETGLGAYLLGDTGLLRALWNESEGRDSIGTTYQKYIQKIMDTRNEFRSYIGLPPYESKISIYISPGHGTYDNGYYDMGAIVGNYYESVINLAISLKLKEILESKGVKVYMARTKEYDPQTPYLIQRVRFINTIHPNAVISIHANANPYSSSVRGYEIYYRKSYDKLLARSVDKAMSISSPIPKRTDPKYMKLIILSGWPPSILIETGYMTNTTDLNILINEKYQWQIANSIAQGVLTFLGKTDH